MYILYGGPLTRAYIVEMVMLEGGLDYELHEVDILNQEHRSPAFLAVNPAGWVPALVTPEGETIYETPAINLYLCERHGLEILAPSVDDPSRGRFLSGYFYLGGELEPAMKRYFYPHRYAGREEDVAMAKQLALETICDRLSVIDGQLSGLGPYHLGERFSLTDLVLAYWVSVLDFEELPDRYPAVKACVDLVTSRPKLRDRFARLVTEARGYARMQADGGGVV